MTIYDRLQSLEPFLSGPWRWATYAVVALGLALAAWAALSGRWRPDGVRRCAWCRHAFGPQEAFERGGARCSECGRVTATERAALRRRGRARAVLLGAAIAAMAAVPLLAWHGVHLLVARALLPRWVAVEQATLPDGTSIALDADPVQAWLGWAPNHRDGAWDGMFLEWIEGSDPPMRRGWPQPWRMRLSAAGASTVLDVTVVGHVRPVFGALAAADMPGAGSPGFGAPLAPDGACTVVIGMPNPGSGGGIEWHEVRAGGDAPTTVPIGWGRWQGPGPDGSWTFLRRCTGFRYELVPGAYLDDGEVACAWHPDARAWRADPARMRRPLRTDALAEASRQAHEAARGCGDPASASQACPELVAAIARGVLEHVFSGNGAGWRAWAIASWPDEAGGASRDAFIGRMESLVAGCECAEDLRALEAASSGGGR